MQNYSSRMESIRSSHSSFLFFILFVLFRRLSCFCDRRAHTKLLEFISREKATLKYEWSHSINYNLSKKEEARHCGGRHPTPYSPWGAPPEISPSNNEMLLTPVDTFFLLPTSIIRNIN